MVSALAPKLLLQVWSFCAEFVCSPCVVGFSSATVVPPNSTNTYRNPLSTTLYYNLYSQELANKIQSNSHNGNDGYLIATVFNAIILY